MLERLLRPTKLDVDPDAPDARQTLKYWLRTLEHFLTAAEAAVSGEESPLDKYGLLMNYLAPSVCAYVGDVSSYEEGIGILKRVYVRPKNVVFARHLLLSPWSNLHFDYRSKSVAFMFNPEGKGKIKNAKIQQW